MSSRPKGSGKFDLAAGKSKDFNKVNRGQEQKLFIVTNRKKLLAGDLSGDYELQILDDEGKEFASVWPTQTLTFETDVAFTVQAEGGNAGVVPCLVGQGFVKTTSGNDQRDNNSGSAASATTEKEYVGGGGTRRTYLP